MRINTTCVDASGDAFRPGKERFHFLVKDFLQVFDRYLVGALATEIFRKPRTDIHFVPAEAVQETTKQLHRRLARTLPAFGLFFDDLVHLVPKCLGNNWLAINLAPLVLRLGLQLPGTVMLEAVEDAEQLRVAPDHAAAGPVAGGIT